MRVHEWLFLMRCSLMVVHVNNFLITSHMSIISTQKAITIKYLNIPRRFFILIWRQCCRPLLSFVLDYFGLHFWSCNIILWIFTLINFLLRMILQRCGACTFINWSFTSFNLLHFCFFICLIL